MNARGERIADMPAAMAFATTGVARRGVADCAIAPR